MKQETKKKIMRRLNHATGGMALGGLFLGTGPIGAGIAVAASVAMLKLRRNMRDDERDFHTGIVSAGLSIISPDTIDEWFDRK